MDRLRSVTENPDLRRHIRCIRLSSFRLFSSQENKRRLERSLVDQIQSDRELRLCRRMYVAEHTKLERLALQWRRCWSVNQLALVDAINRMRDLGTNLGFKYVHSSSENSYADNVAPWGHDRITDALGHRDWLDDQRHAIEAYVVIMRALVETSHTPSSLELGCVLAPVPFELFTTVLLKPLRDNRPFRKLEIIRLTLSISDPHRGLIFDSQHKLRTTLALFYEAICQAENLHTLGLTIISGGSNHSILGEGMVNGMYFLKEINEGATTYTSITPQLRGLELDGHAINFYELVVILQKMQNTLERVDLRHIEHRATKNWSSAEYSPTHKSQYASHVVFCALRKILPKCHISFHDVYGGDGYSEECQSLLLGRNDSDTST